MRNVLLLNPPLFFEHGNARSLDTTTPPLGLLSLAAYVHAHSGEFKVHVVDLVPGRVTLSDVKQRLGALKPLAVGISSMTPQLQGAYELAKTLSRGIRRDYRVFLGGPHVSADPGFVERHKDLFDHAICGEAEITFLDSLERLRAGGEVPRVQQALVPADLDRLPFPDRSLVDTRDYRREDHVRAAFIIASRGCPFGCYFCSSPAMANTRIRQRSVASVMAEIRSCMTFCEGHISFCDDTFTLNRDFVMALCREIPATGLRLRWRCNARIDCVDEDLLRNMKTAGCEAISFGVESASERIRRDVIRKGTFDNDRVLDVVRWCRKIGISVNGNFILGNPGETMRDVEDTKRMILRAGWDGLSLTLPTPFPGSLLYEMAERRGIISPEILDRFARGELGLGYGGRYPIYFAEGFEPEYLLKEMRNIHRRFYITPRTFLTVLWRDLRMPSALWRDAVDVVHLLTRGGTPRKPYAAYRRKGS